MNNPWVMNDWCADRTLFLTKEIPAIQAKLADPSITGVIYRLYLQRALITLKEELNLAKKGINHE